MKTSKIRLVPHKMKKIWEWDSKSLANIGVSYTKVCFTKSVQVVLLRLSSVIVTDEDANLIGMLWRTIFNCFGTFITIFLNYYRSLGIVLDQVGCRFSASNTES